MIGPFSGRRRWLSNFWPCRVEYDGLEYKSVEHAYQAAKTTDQNAREMIRMVWHPGEAKRVGGIFELRPGWEDMKVDIMLDLLRIKFTDPILRRFLLDTRDEELVEVNTWGDTLPTYSIWWSLTSHARTRAIERSERTTGKGWKTLYRQGWRMVRVGEIDR